MHVIMPVFRDTTMKIAKTHGIMHHVTLVTDKFIACEPVSLLNFACLFDF